MSGPARLADPLWARLGSHPLPGAPGDPARTVFAVWAPNARAVSVFGDFDGWDGDRHRLHRGPDGIWTTTVPGATVGMRYKYRITGADGVVRDKADPLARATECPPETASVIVGASSYRWHDDAWLARRVQTDLTTAPLSIYEVHLPSWRPGLGYRELAVALGDYLQALGFTHVQLLPITEHPYGGSWGYQVGSYFAPTTRLGTADDFRFFVDHLHTRGLGVLLDWVPAHFPKDDFALGSFDGTPLYEHADPLRREQPDWGTYAFNLGRAEIREFLIASALYWCSQFHLDGLRVDAVAAMLYLDYSRGPGQWQPNARGTHENDEAVDFLRELNDAVHREIPGAVTIAEESSAWPGVTASTADGGLGFDFKWNLGWMNDVLDFVSLPHHRRGCAQAQLVFPLTYAGAEHFVLPLSHDEVVHGKGTLWSRQPEGSDRAAGVRALLAYQWAHPGKQLLFMGQEFGQITEWSDTDGPDWALLEQSEHAGIARVVTDLNRLHRCFPALHGLDGRARGFDWLDALDTTNTVVGFLRLSADPDEPGGTLACVFNFSQRDLHDYRLGLPGPVRNWTEVLNTGAADYGGTGVGNLGAVRTEPIGSHGRSHSARLTLPAESTVFFTPQHGPPQH
ncbi:1,4-alpha-glucan-branching enzyme [Gordonia hirsuta DSM 44140 = NBRC 16056]|uniref:1,4-alpha-glucan branching enzyme GlgB n=1 Tax=Gordonia hirsuta DSM 44140 = NBRC 16056 TaxID=1121927 RepID=L7LEZ2_9ACTN|nr:1,4-alpha-glucan branching protein GlgB [Gordonia hirsuta]GAC58618.1 1,4-alpha-glucan-branching enzyme [Gordonia hirsuta DSM 44140 = NBRC 16056]